VCQIGTRRAQARKSESANRKRDEFLTRLLLYAANRMRGIMRLAPKEMQTQDLIEDEVHASYRLFSAQLKLLSVESAIT